MQVDKMMSALKMLPYSLWMMLRKNVLSDNKCKKFMHSDMKVYICNIHLQVQQILSIAQ